jgi:cyclic beta-1,2-glucan synthetase
MPLRTRGPLDLRRASDAPEPLIRDEMFSIERLEQHARTLAAAQPVVSGRGNSLSARIAEDGRVLAGAYRLLAEAVREERAITPAAEWLIDNFPLVDEQLREVRDDLPRGYYRQLPKLAGGHLAGYPRVLGVAWAYIAHTDSRFDPEGLARMLRAYQEVAPLTIGELWAVPITLRVLLVDNLRRLAEEVVRSRAARQQADEVADSLSGMDRGAASAVLRRLDRASFSAPARVRLFQRLRDQDPDATPALRMAEALLASSGAGAEEMVRAEHQRQAVMNVTIRNIITSMRLVSWFDWSRFTEGVSLVSGLLSSAGGFADMDFATRDRYRREVEQLAKSSGLPEAAVAQAAVDAAAAAQAGSGASPAVRGGDTGYHLIAEGRPDFERSLRARPALITRARRLYLRHAAANYLACLALGVIACLAAGTWLAGLAGPLPALFPLLALLTLGAVSDLAVALVNRTVTAVFTPEPLPRMDLPDGVPGALRTLVAVPMLLTGQAVIEEQVSGLEVHFLGNREGDLRFALLSDWADAPAEHADGDEDLLAAARSGITALNARYGEAPGGGARFLLLHRARAYNEQEGVWMGWERKRGKLDELNALLLGSADTGFMAGGPEAAAPSGVRYVVVLDADTRMPRGTVARLVGTMAHPLNQPRLDAAKGRVVGGYGILQPRITSILPSEHNASAYQRIYAGPAGIDPYAFAVSDVYQDLFGEGSFTGKGIYDLAAFSAALDGRVPENTLLSHDLFEGVFARAGLAADIELFDEFPSHFLVASARSHRWARGDWQLLPWITGLAGGLRGPRSIPASSRWKMADNLRRTVSAPLTLAALVCAWTILSPADAVLWTALVLGSPLADAVLPVMTGLLPRRKGISLTGHWRSLASDAGTAVARAGLGTALLAYNAALMSDAIVRTLARMLVTRRHLLEWTTAAASKATRKTGLAEFYRAMIRVPVIVLAVCAWLIASGSPSAGVAVPFLALWMLSPFIARYISLPPDEHQPDRLSAADTGFLRLTARRTWRFFEAFAGPDDHNLPPDNFQDDPEPLVAHRTSPTNIGVYLLSVIAARDFGWIGVIEMTERLEAAMASIASLARYRGHLYNWYDTRSLAPLDPAYVSTVDSGNLAGHLLAMAEACRAMTDAPLEAGSAPAGIADAVSLARAAASALPAGRHGQAPGRRQIDDALDALSRALPGLPGDAWPDRLAAADEAAGSLADIAAALVYDHGLAADGALPTWADAAARAVRSHRRDLSLDPSWALPAPRPSLSRIAAGDASGPAADLVRRLRSLADDAARQFEETDFGFLFDPARRLFSIGFRIGDNTLDPGYYDLLASEARLASFLAIAKGDVPFEHWFHLGRPLTPVAGGSALLSWSGSMFEYLMPALVMRTPPGSLLGTTGHLVVERQMRYAAGRGVPWGISESAFNARDLARNYQYSSFGIPGLGLRRGLSDDVVIAPYATALAAMVAPAAAVRNFARLAAAGAAGDYGFRDALDYTRRRVPDGAPVAVVKSYMAHHQGMAIVALDNVVNSDIMVSRFHADPIVEAAELLLHERMPRDVLVARPRGEEVRQTAHIRDAATPVVRRFTSPHDVSPRTHLLSNGNYAVMVTAAGSGYSRWRDLAVTRWREDGTRDAWGSYIYLRDTQSGAVWSAAHQPAGVEADAYDVAYAEEHAEFSRRDGSLATRMTVLVSAEHDAEIRRVTLTNTGRTARSIELTSYAEVVLAPLAADIAHPAFSSLFVQTEFVPGIGAILATRRPRSAGEAAVWAAHVTAVDGPPGITGYETDRARFLGRGRSPRSPAAVLDGRPLSNTTGSVLDPVFSLRRTVRVGPGESVHVVFSTVVAGSRADVLDLADKYRGADAFERAATLAWTQAQVQLHHLGIELDEASLFQRLANRVIFSDPSLRPDPAVLAANTRGASGLWAHGISGDLPIVVVRIDEAEDLDIVRQALRACEYWRAKLLDVDLVVLNEHGATYAEGLQEAIEGLVRTRRSLGQAGGASRRGGVFVLRSEQLSAAERLLLLEAARVVLSSRGGTMADQVLRAERPPVPARPAGDREPAALVREAPRPRPRLEFDNGLGGFAQDGREYAVILGPGQVTPAPWINVVANEGFGFTASESGSGYTWAGNSRENQITPWSNDPVSDPAGEALYVRDDDTGEVWTATALPVRLPESTYRASHGAGYSRFEHEHAGIRLTLTQFVPVSDPVKMSVLRVENRSGRPRRLSVTAYAEWLLGSSRAAAAPHTVTSVDPASGAILARNPWSAEFGGQVAFLDLGGRATAWTADRAEFLGRNAGPERPVGLRRTHRLGQAAGAGLDPCAVLQASLSLAPGASDTVTAALGQAADGPAAAALIARLRSTGADALLAAATAQWDAVLGSVRVRTPDRSMDIMLNDWLLYQTLSCRLWARAAFYQAGGAYGFRDQLQDVLALVTARPDLVRAQVLRAAGRQFAEGDVQHWWHPPGGRGVRTRISDDRLWLAYTAERYITATGDTGVLDEMVPLLDGRLLAAGEDDAYFAPGEARAVSLFDHCAAAIDVSLAVGAHGLPLMGTGDWNDGMNRVGRLGQGESVWLGWFLYDVIERFAPLAAARGETAAAARWRVRQKRLRAALERHGWDGGWYRRAFFDDGSVLGSAANDECRIDAIAQSWSVLSGAAGRKRAVLAMAAMDEYLVRDGDGIAMLFTPPFDRTAMDPGYIKGYPPGVRENGGQYTHGAVWSVLAFAALGDGDRAAQLFSMLSPISHAHNRAGVARYRVEPYVVAADVYSEPPHTGRGGWTWYTGAAGWMYQAGLHGILGVRAAGAALHISPAIPRAWPGYEVDIRHGTARYVVAVENPEHVSAGVRSIEVDGVMAAQPGPVAMADDGVVHRVRVVLGAPDGAAQ